MIKINQYFVGVGLSLTNYENYKVYGILKGSSYTYSYNFDEQQSHQLLNFGNTVVLAAAIQVS